MNRPKTIFLDIINRNIGIPIFIELRRLTKTKIDLDDKSISLEGDDKDE
jgi:hypothetical protein